MTATELLREVLFSILRNWTKAIQIFLMPLGIVVALFVGILFFGARTVAIDGQTVGVPSPWLFLFFPVALFLVFWPVVAWHRLLVLNEQPKGFVPAVRPSSILRYVLNLIGLGLLLALVTMPLMAIIGPIMMRGIDPQALLRGEMPPLSFFVLPALASLPAFYLGLRWCLILPGAAVDDRIGLSGSWTATSGKNALLIFLIIVGSAISLLSQIVLAIVTPIFLAVDQTTLTAIQVIQFAVQMLGTLFVLSLLSTMFLFFVHNEKPTGEQ